MRGYEEMKKALEESVQWYDDRIKLWEAVKFPTKKDGTPFKTLSKNFDGAYIGKYTPVEGYSNPYLTVHGWVGDNWADDQLQIYMDHYNKRLPQHNPDRDTRATGFGGSNEILTLDEIKSEVRYRIEDLKRHKAKEERSLELSEQKYKEVQRKLEEIRDIIGSSDVPEPLKFRLVDIVEDSGSFLRRGW